MEFQVALFYTFIKCGIKILREKRLVNFLADYSQISKASKNILINLIENDFLYEVILERTKEKRRFKILHFLSETGYDKNMTTSIYSNVRKAAIKYSVIRKITKDKNSIDSNNTKSCDGIIYSADYRILYGDEYEQCHDEIEIKEGCMYISGNAFTQVYERIVIPRTVIGIGRDAFLPETCQIENQSPYFIYENNLLMTADRRRLLVCNNRNPIIDIPEQIESIDEWAFPTEQHMVWSSQGVGYNSSIYFLRINGNHIKKINFYEVIFIAANETVRDHLISIGVPKSRIVDDVFVDTYGVIYTRDKKKLLCYPKEINLEDYEILDECEVIEADAFRYYYPPSYYTGDDYSPYTKPEIEGNVLKTLSLPTKLKSLGNNSLSGLVQIKEIKIPNEVYSELSSMLSIYLQNPDNLETKIRTSLFVRR